MICGQFPDYVDSVGSRNVGLLATEPPLIARKHLIELRRRESFELNIYQVETELLQREYLSRCNIHKFSPCNCFFFKSHSVLFSRMT
jgi:hypothetical protein